MNELNICIDIDGTITEPYYWLPRANAFFGKNITENDVTSYKLHEVLGIEDYEYEHFYHLFGPLVHREADIRPGAHKVINELFKDHFIHFVTAREEKMRYVSLEWLKKYKIPMDSLTLLGNPDKVQKARDLKCDFFIEDSYDNAVQLAKAGFEVLLIDCNYNRKPVPANVTRVYHWNQISRIITQAAARLQTKEKQAI